MKKLIALFTMLFATSAFADYRMIVPQQVGGGTDVWARIVAKELEKKLGEKVIIENIPGINDVTGFNKFHNELRKDPKTIMVAHGGNAESFLLQKVDYNYKDYAPVGLQNLTIVVGRRTDSDPFKEVRFSAGSGMNPDLMAITMLICGPLKTVREYQDCFNKKVIYVAGMKGNERRLAYMRGELNVTRETTAAYFKHPKQLKENVDWFSQGVMDIKTGRVVADPNFPGLHFADVYAKRWGNAPSGEFYDAYLLIKNYRDVLQKSLWVDKNNPNRDKLVKALSEMSKDPESVANIEKDTGKYEWVIGDDVNKAMATLEKQLTKKALKDLVWWTAAVIKQDAIYKEDIAQKAK
jgi:hypothetical protein